MAIAEQSASNPNVQDDGAKGFTINHFTPYLFTITAKKGISISIGDSSLFRFLVTLK